MNVSAIIVTRGDVALDDIIASIPTDWQLVIWDNGKGECWIYDFDHGMRIPWMKEPAEDLAVYGRYAAIEHARGDLIYVADDDAIVSDPQAIVDMWDEMHSLAKIEQTPDPAAFVVCNMPANFRHAFYQEHGLVGFGACFHRDAPERAFQRFRRWRDGLGEVGVDAPFPRRALGWGPDLQEWFNRTCDVVFTALTPRVLVDVPYEDLPWASAPNRMWQTEGHREERQRMLDLVLKVRDG